MKTQLNSFIRWLSVVIYSLLSNPRHLAQFALGIAIGLFLIALVVPSFTTVANGLSGGGTH